MLTPHIIHIINSRKKCKLEKNVVEGIRRPLSEHTVELPSPGRHSAYGDPTRLTGRHFKKTLDAPLESKKKRLQRELPTREKNNMPAASAARHALPPQRM